MDNSTATPHNHRLTRNSCFYKQTEMRSDEHDTLKVSEAADEILVGQATAGISITNLAAGTIIKSRFKVIDLLVRGGMGSVYRVVDLESNEHFALKCLDRQQTNDATWRRFDLEA